MNIKIGFIGCGGIANAHMSRLAQIENVVFVGMCDVVKEKAEKAAETYGGKAYTDFEKMLEEVKMDACYICVPPFAHKGQEELCIEKGIHFFVEKPVHLDIQKAKDIAEKVKAKGFITGVGYVLRYFDIIDEAREIISKEKIAFARGRYYGCVPGAGKIEWLIKKELSGGQLIEQATHTVNMMQYLLGDIEEVFAYKFEGINNKIYTTNYNVEDASTLLLKFKNGYIGNLTCTWLWTGFNSGVEVVGKGIIVEYQGNTLTVDRGDRKTTLISSIDPMLEEEKAFINAVVKNEASLVKSDYLDAVKTLAVTLKAHESIEKGIPVKLE